MVCYVNVHSSSVKYCMDRPCKNCEKPLKKTQRSYCSPECVKSGLQGKPILCIQCGQSFKPIRKSSRYCSLTCFRNSSMEARRLENPLPDPVPGATWIPLTGGEFALVDDVDAPIVTQYSWCCVLIKTGGTVKKYAKSALGGTGPGVYMHRFILGDSCEGNVVDHIKGELDNRRQNLRVATHSQNMMNRTSWGDHSKYKGVSYHFGLKKWVSNISTDGQFHRSFFNTELEAAQHYDSQSRIFHGEFARLNFPGPGELSAINETERGEPKSLIDQISSNHRPRTDTTSPSKKKVFHSTIPDGAAVLALPSNESALVDIEDLDKCLQHKWNVHRSRSGIVGYARANINGKNISLHQFILGEPPKGMVIDHIDNDTRNCMKSNLRFATYSQNMRNQRKRSGCSSKYAGVRRGSKNRWAAYGHNNGKNEHLGYFKNEGDAARARDEYVRKNSNGFERYNFPEPGEESALQE